MPSELLKRSPVGFVLNVHGFVARSRKGPRITRPVAQPLLLNVGADVEVELDDECAIVTLLRFEFIDLVERARNRCLVGSPQDAIVEHSSVPAAEEDRSVPGARQLPPEAREPMAFGSFAAIVAHAMHRQVAGVESGDELPQNVLFASPFRTFEKDNRSPTMGDLRQLQLRQLIAERGEFAVKLTGAQIMHVRCSGPHPSSVTAEPRADNRGATYPQLSRPDLARAAQLGGTTRTCSSWSCLGITSDGAFIIRSSAFWFIGKRITSRMLGSSASSMTIRSMPGAEPPCGGAPNLKALIIPAKFVSTSSLV